MRISDWSSDVCSSDLRDITALRGSLTFAWREELIESAPFVKDVETKDKAKPRDVTYSMEQVAALLEAAWGRPERRHVFLYTLIALSTCGRSEAILDLHDHQIDRGLIYFLDPDRDQTSKQIGRAHVCTPVTNAHIVCSLLIEQRNNKYTQT